MNKSAPKAVDANSDLVTAVRNALSKSIHSWLQQIDVSNQDEVIVLKGNVPTFHLKQLALAAAMRVPGVVRVSNHLKVGASFG